MVPAFAPEGDPARRPGSATASCPGDTGARAASFPGWRRRRTYPAPPETGNPMERADGARRGGMCR
ncbi:hypothetical protein C2E23DRAFT_824139 [Lenzites betulinus]|nr:hypothetical protein C2E23DRAFT_824139 [Lenzites betulinus]